MYCSALIDRLYDILPYKFNVNIDNDIDIPADNHYLCQEGNVFAGFCLFVCLLTRKVMDGSF